MWPFKKKESAGGLQALMDPTAAFVGKLHALGGVGYVLLGSGLLVTVAVIVLAQNLLAQLMPLAIALLFAGVGIVVVWQILEYRVSMLKLQMIIRLTERMVDKKLQSHESLDTAVIKVITSEVLIDIWGLNPKLLPGSPATK